jgi:hypothetical protein
MNFIARFFHELRNPHCQHCRDEYDEKNHCNTCEVLAAQNSRLIRDNERLTDLLIDSHIKPITPAVVEDFEPLKPSHIPWNVRRQQLEVEKRAEAISLKNAALPDVGQDNG